MFWRAFVNTFMKYSQLSSFIAFENKPIVEIKSRKNAHYKKPVEMHDSIFVSNLSINVLEWKQKFDERVGFT